MKKLVFLGSAAVLLLASSVRAGWPISHQASYGGWGSCSTCGSGCWATPGCCDRPVSKNDHLWDNYCQEKWCPCVDAAYSRPYWHGAPVNSCYTAAAPACAGPSYGSTLEPSHGPVSGPVSYSRPESTHRAPSPTPAAPRAGDPPPPPQPPQLQAPPQPSLPPNRAPQADQPLELKLLPLSRPRASQP